MKKFIMILAAMFMLAVGTVAQTTVNVNDTSMGYVERYPVWNEVITDSVLNVDTIVSFDTIVTYDTVGDVVDTNYTMDTIMTVDSNYVFVYDTTFMEGYYDYRAFAYDGYLFDRWEIITVYNKWVTADTVIDSVWTDVEVFFDYDTVDGEVLYADGWLMLDGGIPDIDPNDTNSDITSITLMAYFEQDPNLAIEDVEENCIRVYPNPTTDVITIDGEFDYLMIYNIKGKMIYRGTYTCFDFQRCPKGTYFVVLVTNGTQKTIPVVKQ